MADILRLSHQSTANLGDGHVTPFKRGANGVLKWLCNIQNHRAREPDSDLCLPVLEIGACEN